MGCSYYAHSIIGVRLKRNQVFSNIRVKAFDHNYPTEWVVDPKTGKSLWKEETALAPGFSYNDQEDLYFGKYKTVMEDWDYDSSKPDLFVALYISTVSDRQGKGKIHLDPNLVDPHFQVFREECRKFGIWSDENFGLWSYLEVSC